MITTRIVFFAAVLLLCGADAYAQQRPPLPPTTPLRQPPPARQAQSPRIHLEVDGMYHTASQTLSDSSSPIVYAETGSLTAAYDVPAGAGFSGSASFRFWKSLGLGFSASSYSTAFPAEVAGSIPYPFLFNRARQFTGSVSGLERKELALGIHFRGLFQLSPKFTVSVFAGPVRLSVTQDVVTAIQYTEAYPYDTASYSASLVTTDKVNRWGVGAGADAAFYFTRNIGVGLGLKYNGGEAELASLAGRTLTSKIGGAELGGGLRLRF